MYINDNGNSEVVQCVDLSLIPFYILDSCCGSLKKKAKMDWKEILKKLKIVDFQAKFKGEQQGIINIKVENNTYNYSIPGAEAAQAYAQASVASSVTPELETLIKAEVERQLAPLTKPLSLVPESAALEIVKAATATSSVVVINRTLSTSMDAILEKKGL
jgi:hypothetical protein